MSRDAWQRLADSLEPRDVRAEVFGLLGYEPTEKQRLFHAATEYDVLFGGAAGGGKSRALVADDLADAVAIPGIRISVFRRTYDELSESVLKELAGFDFAEALDASWNGSERELRFRNGSLIRYRYAESEVDATRRQGGEFQKLSIDERGLLPPRVVDLLLERIRSGRKDVPVVGVRSTSNPGGIGHGAVKGRYIDPTDQGARPYTDAHGFTVRFIPSRAVDNPHLDEAYRRRLDAIADPARRAAMRDGDWDIFDGMVFTEWRRDRHVVPVLEVPASWRRFAGIDYGYRAPWAVIWCAEDEDRRVWVYRERYGTKVGETEQAHRILAAEGGETPVARYADDAMWATRGDAKSVAAVYSEAGCAITPARKGERLIGWQRVHSYLADGPACAHHRASGWATCPMLHVLDGRAPNLVRTLPSLPYDSKRPEDVDTDAEDHVADALRYLLINLAQPSSFVFDEPAARSADVSVPPGGAFAVVHREPPWARVDFAEGRDPRAGQGVPSPFMGTS